MWLKSDIYISKNPLQENIEIQALNLTFKYLNLKREKDI